MAHWQLFYHAVWATHERKPLIMPEVEPVVYDLLRVKAIGLGATVYAINGMPDHVHCVLAIPPSLAVASVIGQIKGVASAKINTQWLATGLRFAWQEGYGVFSFDAKRLPHVIAYVENQKQHHQGTGLIPILERTDDASVPRLRETSGIYAVGHAAWRDEMLEL